MKITAAIIHEKSAEFKLEEVTLSEPNENEVLIKIIGSGICHTDAVARDQQIHVPLPAVLGHEGSGIVEKVGANVTTVEPGDHVVLSFTSCGHCENCLSGHPASCLTCNVLNFGGKMMDGTNRIHQCDHPVSTFFGQSSFGSFAIAHERNVVKVDKDVDLMLLGPLGCGIQTGAGTVLNKLRPEFGTTIAVYGCGAVGLSAIMAAKIAGCSEIIAIDVLSSRLELAKELGATHVINGKEGNIVDEIRSLTDGGTNYAVETTGVAVVVRQSVQALRTLGTVAIVGVGGEVSFHLFDDLMAQGKTMMGVIEGDSVPQTFIPRLIHFYKKGKFPFDKMVEFYELDEINKAFDDLKKGITVKPIVMMEPNDDCNCCG
ncbi:NAD(P)-dependent alcohol dehydrogenase [Brevibacillus daliensis]|uniref:NAD(P)-dependent alcohol dehydrogenase n=1 Tax=Brevibacillus daliensis TaxID=2892995 RepID=UPI001E379EE6|nr:NAD(P)-dependent alcohol dehydrogenase [Brevibacillus daliensis]